METNSYFAEMRRAMDANPKKKWTNGEIAAYHVYHDTICYGSSCYECDSFPWERDIEDFVTTLRKAGVTEMAVTDHSTGLMDRLHKLAEYGAVVQGICKVTRTTSWSDIETVNGIAVRL